MNRTHASMVTAISKLTKIMGMAFLKVANTNDESVNGNIEIF